MIAAFDVFIVFTKTEEGINLPLIFPILLGQQERRV
jgi:hypothetical protein